MAQPGDAPRPATGGSDWTVQAADSIERVAVGIRAKALIPVTIARGLVYGLLAAVMATLIGVFFAIVTLRVLTAYLVRDEVWAAYLILGGIFVVPGALLLRTASSSKTAKKGR